MTDHLKKEFEEAVARIGGGKGGASDSDKLTLYGFYKQATVGPCVNVPRPGFFDFVKEGMVIGLKVNLVSAIAFLKSQAS